MRLSGKARTRHVVLRLMLVVMVASIVIVFSLEAPETVGASQKVAFWEWSTEQKKDTFEYSATIYPNVTTINQNSTHGIFNDDTSSHICDLRIYSMTNPSNIERLNVTICNLTSTIFTKEWTSADFSSFPTAWGHFVTAAGKKYSVWIEIKGTSEASGSSVITFDMRVEMVMTLADFPAPFAISDVVNTTVVVGTSDPHGPCGPAHTLDTVGGMGVTAVLGRYGGVADARFYLDTDVAWYNASEWKVHYWPIESLTNVITVAGPGVNMITWRYFCNPWYAPVYMYYDAGLGQWVIVTPSTTYRSSDWVGSTPLRDLIVLEVIYVQEEGRYVLWIGGFGGYATRAGCLALQLFDTGQLPFTLDGKAMLIQWIDANGNAKVDPTDTWNTIEIVP